jgi:hypothetical protein
MDIYNNYIKPYTCTFAAGALLFYFAGDTIASVVNAVPVVNTLGTGTRAAVTVGVIAAAAAPVCKYAGQLY